MFTACGKRQKKKKGFYNSKKSINKWIKEFDSSTNNIIGYISNPAPDFQNINQPYISITQGNRHFNYFAIKEKNLIETCIYFAVRLCIEQTWINNQDQFLYPNDDYKPDIEFQNNCLIFTLFHGKNNIQAIRGVNHWIPFTEKEVDAKEKFASNFMSQFLNTLAKTQRRKEEPSRLGVFARDTFSTEAGAVLAAGLELWRYYHAKIKNNRTASVNASFYDIREFFQGRNDAGKMNNKSNDETYNALIKTLRETLDALAKKIEPKIYEYGFLKE